MVGHYRVIKVSLTHRPACPILLQHMGMVNSRKKSHLKKKKKKKKQETKNLSMLIDTVGEFSQQRPEFLSLRK